MIKPDSIPGSLPTVSAVYRVWHQDQVVYVGQATNLKQRWKAHHIYPKLISTYGIDWALEWVEVHPSNLTRAEAFAYRQFNPVLNQANPSAKLGNPNLAPTKAQQT